MKDTLDLELVGDDRDDYGHPVARQGLGPLVERKQRNPRRRKFQLVVLGVFMPPGSVTAQVGLMRQGRESMRHECGYAEWDDEKGNRRVHG